MSESTTQVAEATEVAVPFLTFKPSRTKVNPASHVGDEILWVTQSPQGKDRALIMTDGSELEVGQVIEAKHVTRKSSYGQVTVVGRQVRVNATDERATEGDVPEKPLSLRYGTLVTPVAAAPAEAA